MTPAEELALLGSLKETQTVLGRKFTWRTLNSDEEAAANAAAALFDERTRQRVIKLERLARAIESIDSVPFASVSKDDESRGITHLQKVRELIYKWQPPVVDRVYSEYEKLEKRRDQAITELEKNGASPLTSSGAGR